MRYPEHFEVCHPDQPVVLEDALRVRAELRGNELLHEEREGFADSLLEVETDQLQYGAVSTESSGAKASMASSIFLVASVSEFPAFCATIPFSTGTTVPVM